MDKNITVKCNIEVYRFAFAGFIAGNFLPRKGEFITVDSVYRLGLEQKGLPTELEVVHVSHGQQWIELEVWFSAVQNQSLIQRQIKY